MNISKTDITLLNEMYDQATKNPREQMNVDDFVSINGRSGKIVHTDNKSVYLQEYDDSTDELGAQKWVVKWDEIETFEIDPSEVGVDPYEVPNDPYETDIDPYEVPDEDNQ